MQGSCDKIRELMRKIVENITKHDIPALRDVLSNPNIEYKEEDYQIEWLKGILSVAQAYLEAKAGNYERLEKLAGIS
jgi:hypothetical protein